MNDDDQAVSSPAKDPLESAVDDLIESVRRDADAHRVGAGYWTMMHYSLGLPAVILSTAAGTALLADVGNQMLAGGLALVVAVITGLWTWLNPNEKALAHQTASAKYKALLDRARELLIDLAGELDRTSVRSTLRELSQERSRLVAESPHLLPKFLSIAAGRAR